VTASIAALIPTRNRARLAMAAVRSLAAQDVPIDIYVSDNGSSPEPLRRFCRGRPGVTYLRPDRELAMPEHWDWALNQVLERSAASHVTVHYDRKVSKPRSWGRLAADAAERPDDLMSFSTDQVSPVPPPRRLWQAPWTGKLFEIACARLAAAIARADVAAAGQALPVLSNCLVPRDVFAAIARRFGSICISATPDSCFTARFLAVSDRYFHHDAALGIVYAAHRSTGLGYMRGRGGDFADYVAMFGRRAWLEAAPLPGVNLGMNMLYHEYELVRRETGDRLPPLDRRAVLDDLAQALVWIEDAGERAAMAARLREDGWSGAEPPPHEPPPWDLRREELKCRWRMFRHGEVPAHISGFSFLSDGNAIRAALRYPRPPDAAPAFLEALGPVEVRG
jgi:hypothetical protein